MGVGGRVYSFFLLELGQTKVKFMLQNSPWDQGEAVTLVEITPFSLLHSASSMPLLASPGSFS